MVVIPLPLLQQQQQPCWPTLARVPSHATPCCPRCKAPILQAAELVLTRVGKPYLFKALLPFRQTSEKCITVAEAYSRRDEASHVATQVRGLYSIAVKPQSVFSMGSMQRPAPVAFPLTVMLALYQCMMA